MKPRQLLAWVGAALLVALHLVTWRPSSGLAWAGPLPPELVWRLLWMAGAFVYLLWFTAVVWEEDS